MKHTQGPWEIALNTATGSHFAADQRFIQIGGTSEEGQANARLIAAAPEMLETLKMVLKVIDPANSTARRVVQDMIAQAEGK